MDQVPVMGLLASGNKASLHCKQTYACSPRCTCQEGQLVNNASPAAPEGGGAEAGERP